MTEDPGVLQEVTWMTVEPSRLLLRLMPVPRRLPLRKLRLQRPLLLLPGAEEISTGRLLVATLPRARPLRPSQGSHE